MQTPLLQINTDIVYNYLKQYNHTFKQYIKMFNLDMSILDKSMFELSTGQLITVMIIAYIISDKDVLLIDEGFEVISLSTRTKILDILETKYYQIITTTKNIEIYNNRRINLINI